MRAREAMKRGAIAVVAAVALLLSSSAAGAPFRAYYSGQIGDGGDSAWVEFHAKFHSKRAFETGKPPRTVFAFHWFNVPVLSPVRACFDSLTDNGFYVPVNDAGEFHGTFEVPNTDHRGIVRRGKFKHQNRNVTGRLRVKGGHFSDGCAPAESGILSWVAHHRAGRD